MSFICFEIQVKIMRADIPPEILNQAVTFVNESMDMHSIEKVFEIELVICTVHAVDSLLNVHILISRRIWQLT